jgi:hypothetical protein
LLVMLGVLRLLTRLAYAATVEQIRVVPIVRTACFALPQTYLPGRSWAGYRFLTA